MMWQSFFQSLQHAGRSGGFFVFALLVFLLMAFFWKFALVVIGVIVFYRVLLAASRMVRGTAPRDSMWISGAMGFFSPLIVLCGSFVCILSASVGLSAWSDNVGVTHFIAHRSNEVASLAATAGIISTLLAIAQSIAISCTRIRSPVGQLVYAAVPLTLGALAWFLIAQL